jgi:large subunit ribosomal protein L21
MKYAIVETGGKQYKAVEGTTIDVDLLEIEIGKEVVLESVLLLVEDEKIIVGTPTIKGTKITTSVLDHVKGPKVVIFKYSPKKRIRVKTGHRQQYTRLKVESISVE